MFTRSRNGLDAILHRKRVSWSTRLRADPKRTLARTIYCWRPQAEKARGPDALKVVCISDTHNTQPNLPPGDVLIHAGDLSQSGSYEEIQATFDWLNAEPHTYKIVIAGNHDGILAERFVPAEYSQWKDLRWGNIIYLQDSSANLKFPGGRTLKVYGSPWTRRHGNWSFQYPRGEDRYTNTFPEDSDIVVTHGPPLYHLDLGAYGDKFLLREMWRVRPRLHVFGHIHEGYGKEFVNFDSVQICYEGVLEGTHGILTLIKMLWFVLLQLFISRNRNYTTLVNASIVGGLRDEINRSSIVEYI